MGRFRRLAGIAAVAAVAGLGPSLMSAQEHPLVKDRPGAWRAADVRAAALPADTRGAALAVADRVLAIVRRMPAMAPAAGFEAVPHTFVTLENADQSDNPRLPKFARIEVTVNLVPFERTASGVEGNERDTAGSVTVVVNGLEHVGAMPKGEGWADEQGAFIQDPEEPVEMAHGFPVYQDGNLDKWLLMRRHDVPVLAPVSRERYLSVLIRQRQDEVKRVEERRAKIPAGVPASVVATVDEALTQQRAQLAVLQKQLSSMSAADRRSPTILGSSGAGEPLSFVTPGEGNAVVFFNPALMDPKLGPAAPQTLSVRVRGNDDLFPDLGARLEEQIDWAALNGLLR